MPVINISVENKIAEADGTLYVCGNSDFVAKFAFDAEWEAYENKTARFCYNNSYVDVVFTGDKCPVPIISGTYFFNIGVYAGDLHTTTPARVPCKKSILCDTGFPADPPDDVYNQIMAKLNSLGSADPEAIAKAVADYLAAHLIEETDPTVPEWAKADITGATVGQIVKIAAVDASGVPTAWSPVDMPSGGGDLQWIEVVDITTEEQTQKLTISVDKDGRPISQYNALWMICSILFPADATQTSVNGAPWIYPIPKTGDNVYRVIANVAGWKTITRTLTYAWAGLPRITWSSSVAGQGTFGTDGDPDFLSGLCVYLNSASDHIPAGARVRIAVLSKGVTA